jgi:transposase
LNKDTIKNEILPHLSVAKRGFQSRSSLIEVINAILYKLKTGCQWAYLPVKELFNGKVLKYSAVFHHYNKWSKKCEWRSL